MHKGWAWIAGASEGLGLAFGAALAARGHAVMLLARRADVLADEAQKLRATYGVPVEFRPVDLAHRDLAATLAELLVSHPPRIAVYNAAHVPIGAFVEQAPPDLLRAVDVNVVGPLLWTRLIGAFMAARGGGDLILMSSLAGEQGTPGVSTYAATKAFNTRLAEGLWEEFKPLGVQVLVCVAGAIATPGYAQSAATPVAGQLDPAVVAERTLAAVARGPRYVPGWQNRLGALLLGRVLPRAWGVRIMARFTRTAGVGQ